MLTVMEKTQFYIWLPSNSSMSIFPENTLAEYRVRLPQSLKLVDEWEVAITEVQYPHSWNNVHDKEKWNRFYVKKGLVVEGYTLPSGHYSSVENIVKKLNAVLQDSTHKGQVWFAYDKLTRKVTIHIQDGCEAFFSDMGVMLGFDLKAVYTKTTARS